MEYAKYHFETEESLWAEALVDDEWFAGHLKSHQGFVDKVRGLQNETTENNAEASLDDLLSFLTGWLAHHILYEDKRLAVVLLAVRGGEQIADAKRQALEAMSGSASGLIQSVLSMYKELSTRTLALERESYARKLAEEALRAQEAQWTEILGATNDVLWDWDFKQIESSRKDLGPQALEWSAEGSYQVHPDDWPGLREEFLAHLTGQTEVFSHQHRVLDREGKERWVQSRGKVIAHDADGRPVRMVGTQTDITERRTAEVTLQRERDTRLLISEFASDFMASSPEDYDIAINRALQRAGAHMQADRTYVFLLSDDGQYMSNTHEWCAPGIAAEIDNLQDIPSDSTPWWWQQLHTTGYVLVPRVDEMPPHAHVEQSILQAQHIRSVCVYPLRVDGRLAGFLGNDAVTSEREWGSEVLQFLELMSDLLGIALEHRLLHLRRAETMERLERAESLAHLGHWTLDLISRKVSWSEEVFRIFGVSPEEGVPDLEGYFRLVHPEDRSVVFAEFDKARRNSGVLQLEHRVTVEGAGIRHVEVRGKFNAGPDGQPAHAEGTVQDITEKSRHQEALHRLAYEDALTGLPNRRVLEERLSRAIVNCAPGGPRLALAILDLDNFRSANDQYGPDTGDRILIVLSQRMAQWLGKSVLFARVGGDEFAVLFGRLGNDDDYLLRLNQLLAMINEPFVLDGVSFRITASIGVTELPQAVYLSGEQLIRQAQQALFEAKLTGKNRVLKHDAARELDKRALTSELLRIEQALQVGEFVLFYQPKVHMASGTVFGVEALIRWQTPSGELIPPSSFLPTVQGHPLEIELGDWVIRSALDQMVKWHSRSLELQVSVNVTSQHILSGRFVDKLAAELKRHPQVPPAALQLEILESSAIHDLAAVSKIMQDCHQLGVSFALDDFGTGFSSLAYLKHLPASVLKIDQGFVRGMLESSDDLSIISGVVGMAQAFGLQVLAEGVESAEHGELLLRLGCDQGQGYGIARPMPAENLPDWIRGWKPCQSWRGQSQVDPQNLPLLYAEVDHRRWVLELEQWLRGERTTLPAMDHRQCRVGIWMESDARARFALNPEFISLMNLHRDLHLLGTSAVDACAKGEHDNALATLADIKTQRDRFLDELKMLVR